MVATTISVSSPGPRPLWIPPDLKFDELSPALQSAIRDIIDPVYDKLVLQATDPIERLSGLTLVHLQWLELIEQIDLGQDMGRTLREQVGTMAHEEKLRRHLRLLTHKAKVGKFLLEVQRFHARSGNWERLPPVAPETEAPNGK